MPSYTTGLLGVLVPQLHLESHDSLTLLGLISIRGGLFDECLDNSTHVILEFALSDEMGERGMGQGTHHVFRACGAALTPAASSQSKGTQSHLRMQLDLGRRERTYPEVSYNVV